MVSDKFSSLPPHHYTSDGDPPSNAKNTYRAIHIIIYYTNFHSPAGGFFFPPGVASDRYNNIAVRLRTESAADRGCRRRRRRPSPGVLRDGKSIVPARSGDCGVALCRPVHASVRVTRQPAAAIPLPRQSARTPLHHTYIVSAVALDFPRRRRALRHRLTPFGGTLPKFHPSPQPFSTPFVSLDTATVVRDRALRSVRVYSVLRIIICIFYMGYTTKRYCFAGRPGIQFFYGGGSMS